MKSLNNCLITAALSLILVLLSTVHASAEIGFQIPDYIPERFSDLEWRISGNMNLGFTGTKSYTTSAQDRDYDNQKVQIGNKIVHQYYTPDEFYNSSGQFQLVLRRGNSQTEGHSLITHDYFSNVTSEENSKSIDIDWDPEFEAGRYLFSDYYLSGKAALVIDYSHTFPSSFDSKSWSLQRYDDREVESTSDTHGEFEYTYLQTSGLFELSAGYGRIYEGRYASTALYMVEDLREQGLLVRELTKKEMLILTESVYQLRHKHQIDQRIFKIEALKQILDYLIEVGAMDGESVLSYLIIQDVWDYSPHKKDRKFGYSAKLGYGLFWKYYENSRDRDQARELITKIDYYDESLTDEVHISPYNSEYHSSNIMKNHNEYIFGEFSYYKPLSRKLQFNLIARYNLFLNKGGAYLPRSYYGIAESNLYSLDIYIQRLDDYNSGVISTELNYIYNSRTELNVVASIVNENYTSRSYRGNHELSLVDYGSRNFNISSELIYRISIPTEISCRISYYSENYKSRDLYDYYEEGARQGLSLTGSINHYLF